MDLCQLLDTKGMTFVIQCLNKLSRKNLIKLFQIVKNNTAFEYKFKVLFDKICILTKMKSISKQNKSYKMGNKDNRLYLPINFTSKQIEDSNLPATLIQWEVKQALPSNLNYNDIRVLTYKLSKTIGKIIFNYNLILKRLDSDINWKLVCNCKQLGPFVNLTYKHVSYNLQ